MSVAAFETLAPALATPGPAPAGDAAVAASSREATPAAGRIPAIDGLRGVASLQVFVYHYLLHGIAATAPAALLFVNRLSGQLLNGVDLFFVLSGFLISQILLNARQSSSYYGTFYARRFFRIVPLYVAVLVTFLAASATPLTRLAPRLFETGVPAWTYWLFVQNFWMASANTFGAIWLAGTWSLAVEEQFYLVLPPIVRRCKPGTLGWFAAGCMIVAPLVRLMISKTGILPAQAGYVLLISRCDALAAGILLSLTIQYRAQWLERWSHRLPAALAVVGVGALAIAYRPTDFFVKFTFVERTIAACFYAGVLAYVLTARRSWLTRTLGTPVARMFGNMAYANYLLHPIVLGLAIPMLTGHAPGLRTWTDLGPIAVAAVITVLLTALSWRYFERPLLRIGHRFAY